MNLQGGLKSDLNTDGRTDGLTKKLAEVDSHLSAVDAGARTEIPTLGDIIADAVQHDRLWMTDQRHPVTRRGERAEIPGHVRAAVWFRDRGKCELCNYPVPSDRPWHLDHITPWSAGGGDDTTNLRVLCERHNTDRSNRIDPTERPRRAATWWCANCYDLNRHTWTYGASPTCPTHWKTADPSKTRCRVVRHYWRVWQETGEAPTWHQRPMLTTFDQVAYCAHCNAPAVTGRVL